MSHLTPAEIVDAAEGHPGPDEREHLRACARCAQQVRDAAGLLGEVKAIAVPEPSPLFWDHLSANIRQRIEAAPTPRHSRTWIWAPATALAGVVALVIGVSNTHVTKPTPAGTVPVNRPAERLMVESSASDAGWSLVSDASEDLGWDEAQVAGFAVRPGAAERAAEELPDDQREELGRLLQEEVARLKT